MVKYLLLFILIFSSAFSDEYSLKGEDLLSQKIESFLGNDVYERKLNFINVIFEPKSAFYKNDRVDIIKVVKTLKENGLLELFFKNPQELHLHFKTSGAPLFFVKIMSDTLRNIGYYRYVTTSSSLNSSAFKWNIALTSEYATDPIILQNELQKSGSSIIDIERMSATDWTYTIDMSSAFLNLTHLKDREELKLKHSLYAHWLDCSEVDLLSIKSTRRNRWYPYIAFYDASLHLLKVIKKDKKHAFLKLNIPAEAKYMKISDMYTLKNVKDALLLTPEGTR